MICEPTTRFRRGASGRVCRPAAYLKIVGAVGVGLGAALAGGCGPAVDQPETASVSRWDSAGVLIVENRDSVRGARVRLGREPSLELGCRECDDPAEAFGIVADVLRFGDGRIAVLDVLQRKVRVFGADGAFLHDIGSSGEGPGEFTLPGRIALIRGDSIVVHDPGRFVQHVFSDSGEYGRPIPDVRVPEWGGLRDLPRAWLPDGRYLIAEEVDARKLPMERGVAAGEWRLMTADGRESATLGILPATHGERQPGVEGYQVSGRTLLSPRSSYGTDSTGFWHAFPQTYELRHVLPDGRVDRIVRRRWSPLPATESLKARTLEWRAREGRERARTLSAAGRRRLEAEVEAATVADTLPAFRRIEVTKEGGVWVERYPVLAKMDFRVQDRYGPRFVGRSEWDVFNPEGRWLGAVLVPEGFRIHEIGPDYVLGFWRDELDVSFVRLYRLITATPAQTQERHEP